MERVIGALAQHAVDGDEILHRRDFRRQDDAVARKPDLLRPRRRQKRGSHHRLARDRSGIERRGARRIVVHERGQKLLVERAPVGADPHRLAVAHRNLDDPAKLEVALVLEADIARIDAIFIERFGAGRMIAEQLVADIVEVADQRHAHAAFQQRVADVRHCGCGLVAIDRDPHELGARAPQRGDLTRRRLDVGCVGVGHRLDDDRRAAADHNGRVAFADPNCDGRAARPRPAWRVGDRKIHRRHPFFNADRPHFAARVLSFTGEFVIPRPGRRRPASGQGASILSPQCNIEPHRNAI